MSRSFLENARGVLICVALLTAAPVLPSAATNGSVTVQWDANTIDLDLNGYRVFLTTDSSVYNMTPAQAAGVATTRDVGKTTIETTFNSLDTTRTYHVAVTSRDTSGNQSIFSNVASGLPGAVPTLLTVSPTTAKQGTIDLPVTLNGSEFQPGAGVSFGQGVTVRSVDTSSVPTRLVARIDVNAVARVDTRNVTVTNPGNAAFTKPNAFTVSLDVGRVDINGSNRIDGGDLTDVAAAFARTSSDPGYSVAYDLNVDGVVDGTDIALLITYFGLIGPF